VAKKTADVINRSEEIRKLLTANPKITAKEVETALGEKGIKTSPNLFYLVKGHMKGRKAKKRKAENAIAKVASTTGTVDPLSAILKIKHLASEVGGLKKLRSLVEALSE
jgi:hypothetical protein